MTMTRYERQAAAILTAGAALNVILNLVLIPCWGIEGAAMATSSSLILWNLTMLVFVRLRLGIRVTIFG